MRGFTYGKTPLRVLKKCPSCLESYLSKWRHIRKESINAPKHSSGLLSFGNTPEGLWSGLCGVWPHSQPTVFTLYNIWVLHGADSQTNMSLNIPVAQHS